jgi:hypothetical protein
VRINSSWLNSQLVQGELPDGQKWGMGVASCLTTHRRISHRSAACCRGWQVKSRAGFALAAGLGKCYYKPAGRMSLPCHWPKSSGFLSTGLEPGVWHKSSQQSRETQPKHHLEPLGQFKLFLPTKVGQKRIAGSWKQPRLSSN